MVLLLVVLAAVPVIAVGRDYRSRDRIIGGVPATIDEFPFIVHIETLFVDTGGYSSCGGSIVTEEWVLTAAHCVKNIRSRRTPWVYARGGSSFQNKGGIVRQAKEIVAHNYPPHDIALIKVDEAWPLNGITISLARLPRQDDPIPVGSPATIMGWGGTDVRGRPPEMLMKQEVVVISFDDCWYSLVWLLMFVSVKQICTSPGPGETPSRIFKGDSGGPVLVNGQVVGIKSQGFTHPDFVFPDVHTRVSWYIDWIEQTTAERQVMDILTNTYAMRKQKR